MSIGVARMSEGASFSLDTAACHEAKTAMGMVSVIPKPCQPPSVSSPTSDANTTSAHGTTGPAHGLVSVYHGRLHEVDDTKD